MVCCVLGAGAGLAAPLDGAAAEADSSTTSQPAQGIGQPAPGNAHPAPGIAQPEPGIAQPRQDIYAQLDTLNCAGVSQVCKQTIPSLFVESYPDSLLDLLSYWEYVCGPNEPQTRTLVLGAIWDGAFSEELYGNEIMDLLIWYADPRRRIIPEDEEIDPDLASGGVASPADFTPDSELYDEFTVSLADQLLPHVPPDTPELFFCLFYSGRDEGAWEMLESGVLQGTYLQRVYDWENERLGLERDPNTNFFTIGYWSPGGNLDLVGNHLNMGYMLEQRRPRHFWRMTADLLLGRSEAPYLVDKPEIRARSDRFNSLSVMLEGGVQAYRIGHNSLDLYAGAGLEFMLPFLDVEEDESVMLINLKSLAGVGYRREFGSYRKWIVGLDLRREWIGDRNKDGTPLDGQAWSVRLAVGFNPNSDLDRRMDGLGR